MMGKIMLASLLALFLITTVSVEAATTVVSTVETKSGVRFYGENPNLTEHKPQANLEEGHHHKPSDNGSNHSGKLPQTGESQDKTLYTVIGTIVVGAVLVLAFKNKKGRVIK